MKQNTKFKGRVENGKIQLYNKEMFNKVVQDKEGKEITLELKQWRKSRSNNQNSYYWAVIIGILAEYSGEDGAEGMERVHIGLRMKFLPLENNFLPSCQSTTQLDTSEFEEYCRKIRTWASVEHECFIPLPNEVIVHDNFTFTYIQS